MQQTITVPVHLGSEDFRSFALFDTFIRRRHWRPPVIFAAILLASAAVCLYKGGVLLAAVLGTVAVLLPAVYVGSYVYSVFAQCRKAGLAKYPLVYTVTFEAEQLRVQTPGEEATFRYDKLFAAYRRNACIYLYVHPVKAFLLPAADIEGGTRVLWEALKTVMPPEKIFDRQK